LSGEVEAVLLRASNKRPEEQYQTGRELIDALKMALEAGQLVSTAPAGPLASTGVESSAVLSSSRMAGRQGDDLLGHQLDEYRLEAMKPLL
jgi:hypothetical protein